MTLAVRDKGGLELLVELEQAGALTPTGLDLPEGISFDTYEALMGMLGQVHRSASWLIGDALAYGEQVFGESYAQAAEATQLAPQTLMNLCSVARRVPPSVRRASLPFSSHALVASLKPREQAKWLKQAEQEGWTRAQLAQALKDLPPEVGKQSVRDLARAVWLAATFNGDSYVVPVAPMKALGDAL